MLRKLRVIGAAVAMVGLSAALIVLNGCVGYASFPYEEGGKSELATQDPNTPPADELIALSLNWVVTKYPPRSPAVEGQPRYTVNMPKGVRRDVYDRILKNLGGQAAPLTPETAAQLPIYHVGRVWIRGRDAKVDVLRPVLEGPRGPGGDVVYQPVTLRIEGGFEPWRIKRHQVWEVGTVPVPELYFYPDPGKQRGWYYGRKEPGQVGATEHRSEGEPEPQRDSNGGGGGGG